MAKIKCVSFYMLVEGFKDTQDHRSTLSVTSVLYARRGF